MTSYTYGVGFPEKEGGKERGGEVSSEGLAINHREDEGDWTIKDAR